MEKFKIGEIPDTFQPPNADFNIEKMYKTLISNYEIDIKEYYLFDSESIVKTFKHENEEFDKLFQKEANDLVIELCLSGNKIGDKIPLFLIRTDQNEIIRLHEQADGKGVLKKYYKANDAWEYYTEERMMF